MFLLSAEGICPRLTKGPRKNNFYKLILACLPESAMKAACRTLK
jgi:hypothetical protein